MSKLGGDEEGEAPKRSKMEILKQLKATQQLDYSGQELRCLPPEVEYMTNLVMASLARNCLEELPKSVSKLKNIKFLQLNENQFTKIPKPLGGLVNLQLLDMRSNRIQSMDPSVIKKWTSLVKLILRFNKITIIPREIGHLKALRFFSIRNNFLISVPPEVNELTSLEVFDARNNQLKSIPPMDKLQRLLELDLQHNTLSSFPVENEALTNLHRLSLGYNNLSFPSAVLSMVSLTELDLEHNQIATVPPEIGNLVNLKVLYLSANMITVLPEALGNCTHLETLLVRDNQLTKLPAFIDKLKALVSLDLRSNPLDFITKQDSGAWSKVAGSLAWITNLRLDETFDPSKRDIQMSLDRRSRRAGTGPSSSRGGKSSLMDMFGISHVPENEAPVCKDELSDLRALVQDVDESKPNLSGKLIVDHGVCEETNEKGLTRAKKELQMEDAHCVHAPFDKNKARALFCVFDGHAGIEAAQQATEVFPAELSAIIKKTEKKAKAKAAKDDYSEELHYAFISTDGLMSAHQYMGCTATAVFFWMEKDKKKFVQVANVGDSTAYLHRGGNEVECLSEDHKLENLYERERVQASGIFLNEGQTRLGGIGVTRALGDHFAKDSACGLLGAPYVSDSVLLMEDDDYLIVASDGLWDVCSPEKAFEMISNKPELGCAEHAKRLMKHALSFKDCKDNVTIIVVKLN